MSKHRDFQNKKVCRYFLRGECLKGDSCTFRHEREDCHFYLAGYCRDGTECTFNHDVSQAQRLRGGRHRSDDDEVYDDYYDDGGGEWNEHDSEEENHPPVKNGNYEIAPRFTKNAAVSKSKEDAVVCAHYKLGKCIYGDKCFKRHVTSPPVKVKTIVEYIKICDFFQRGACAYGDKCTKSHEKLPLYKKDVTEEMRYKKVVKTIASPVKEETGTQHPAPRNTISNNNKINTKPIQPARPSKAVENAPNVSFVDGSVERSRLAGEVWQGDAEEVTSSPLAVNGSNSPTPYHLLNGQADGKPEMKPVTGSKPKGTKFILSGSLSKSFPTSPEVLMDDLLTEAESHTDIFISDSEYCGSEQGDDDQPLMSSLTESEQRSSSHSLLQRSSVNQPHQMSSSYQQSQMSSSNYREQPLPLSQQGKFGPYNQANPLASLPFDLAMARQMASSNQHELMSSLSKQSSLYNEHNHQMPAKVLSQPTRMPSLAQESNTAVGHRPTIEFVTEARYVDEESVKKEAAAPQRLPPSPAGIKFPSKTAAAISGACSVVAKNSFGGNLTQQLQFAVNSNKQVNNDGYFFGSDFNVTTSSTAVIPTGLRYGFSDEPMRPPAAYVPRGAMTRGPRLHSRGHPNLPPRLLASLKAKQEHISISNQFDGIGRRAFPDNNFIAPFGRGAKTLNIRAVPSGYLNGRGLGHKENSFNPGPITHQATRTSKHATRPTLNEIERTEENAAKDVIKDDINTESAPKNKEDGMSKSELKKVNGNNVKTTKGLQTKRINKNNLHGARKPSSELCNNKFEALIESGEDKKDDITESESEDDKPSKSNNGHKAVPVTPRKGQQKETTHFGKKKRVKVKRMRQMPHVVIGITNVIEELIREDEDSEVYENDFVSTSPTSDMDQLIKSTESGHELTAMEKKRLKRESKKERKKKQQHVSIEQMKKDGNNAYDNGEFLEAIDIYSNGIAKCGANNPSAVLLCNRAAGYIMSEQYRLALADARRSRDFAVGSYSRLNAKITLYTTKRIVICCLVMGHIDDGRSAIGELEMLAKCLDRKTKSETILLLENVKVLYVAFETHIQTAKSLEGKKDYDNAMSSVNRGLTISPFSALLKMMKAKYEVLKGDLNQAQITLEQIDQKDPHYPKSLFHFVQGLIRYYTNDLDRAISGFKEARANYPEAEKWKEKAKLMRQEFNRAGKLLKDNDIVEALQLLDDCLYIDPSNVSFCKSVESIRTVVNKKVMKFKRLIDRLSELAKTNPEIIKAHLDKHPDSPLKDLITVEEEVEESFVEVVYQPRNEVLAIRRSHFNMDTALGEIGGILVEIMKISRSDSCRDYDDEDVDDDDNGDDDEYDNDDNEQSNFNANNDENSSSPTMDEKTKTSGGIVVISRGFSKLWRHVLSDQETTPYSQ